MVQVGTARHKAGFGFDVHDANCAAAPGPPHRARLPLARVGLPGPCERNRHGGVGAMTHEAQPHLAAGARRLAEAKVEQVCIHTVCRLAVDSNDDVAYLAALPCCFSVNSNHCGLRIGGEGEDISDKTAPE